MAEALHDIPDPREDLSNIHRKSGEVNADLDTFEWLEMRTMAALPPGGNPGSIASILKLRASRIKQAIGEMGVDALGAESRRWRSSSVHGGAASRQAQTLVPEYFNSRAFTIFGGAAEIQLGIIAKTALGV